MSAYTQPRPFAAKYPGTCLCGARFAVGAMIYWDSSVRRATLCPACKAPTAKAGTVHTLPGNSGITVRFDRHPVTKAIVLAAFSEVCGAWGSCDVYRLKDGEWYLAQSGREGCFSGVVSHSTIEKWRIALGEEMAT